MQEDRPRNIEVVGHRVIVVKFVNAIGHRVGERIFLRVDGAGLDGGDRLGQIPTQRHGAEQLERARLHVARQHADAHVLHVGGARIVRSLFEI